MAINNAPIFTGQPDIQWINAVVTANTTTDLTGGTIYLVFTADATNGGFVQKLSMRSLGTNIATVIRVWLNNGSTTGTASNNTLIAEATLAATTLSQVAAVAHYEVPLNIALPAGYRIYVTVGTTVAVGYDVAAWGGKYTAAA